MDTSVDYEFCARTSRCIARYELNECRLHEVNGHESSNVSKTEWEFMFEKKGIVKQNKFYLTNLVEENSSYLSTREHERVGIACEA